METLPSFGAAIAGGKDFNRDGKPDFLIGAPGADANGLNQAGAPYIFDGSRGRLAAPSLTVGTEPHSVLAFDFNKDGHLDLAVSNRTDATLGIYLGDGTGAFALHAAVPIAAAAAP